MKRIFKDSHGLYIYSTHIYRPEVSLLVETEDQPTLPSIYKPNDLVTVRMVGMRPGTIAVFPKDNTRLYEERWFSHGDITGRTASECWAPIPGGPSEAILLERHLANEDLLKIAKEATSWIQLDTEAHKHGLYAKLTAAIARVEKAYSPLE